MSPGETRTSRVERPTISNDGREMGFEAPRRHGSSKDSLADPRRHDLSLHLPRRRPGPSREAEGNCRSASLTTSPNWAPAFAGEGKEGTGLQRWRMPVGLHPVVAERSSGSNPRVSPSSSPAPQQSGECRVGLHLATMALPKGPSHVFLVAGTTTRWRMPAGLQDRAPASRQEVGGSTPPPGSRIAQAKCLARTRRQYRNTPANAGGTTGQSACRESRRSVVQLHPRVTG